MDGEGLEGISHVGRRANVHAVHARRRNVSTPSAPGGPAPPAPPQGAMFTMLAMMLMMVLLVVNPSIRNTLGDIADPILSPVLPEERFVIITLLILGSASMLVNTVLRNLFMDPIAQAHLST